MRRLLAPGLLAAAVACADAPDAVAPEDSRPLDVAPASLVMFATYLAPTTVTRSGPAPQVDTIDLSALPRDRYMAPFRLRVYEHAGIEVKGTIAVDGVNVVRLGLLAAGDSITRGILVGPTSKVVLTLSGTAGGAVTLRIDGAVLPPPVIDIRRPGRGAMIRRGGIGAYDIELRGDACDASFPIVELSVNGVAQAVSGSELCEPFATTVRSPWGMTTVVVEATNAAGRSARRVQSFLRSRHWSTPALSIDTGAAYDSLVDVGWAAAVRYEQAGFVKLESLIPAYASDVQALGSSFGSFEIGSCGGLGSGWEVTRGAVTNGIDLMDFSVPNSNRLHVTIQYDASVAFTARYCSFRTDVDGSGTIAATNATLEADLSFGIVPVTGGVEVAVDQLDISDVASASINLVGLGGVPADDRAVLQDALFDVFAQAIAADGLALMDSIATMGLAFERLQLPSDRLNGIGVDLTHAASAIALRNNGVDVGFRAQAAPLVARGGTAPQRGSIRTRAVPSLLPVANDVNEYVGDDFVNQVLWSAWQAGWFDALDLETITDPIDGLSAELYSLMPPVMMSGGGERVRFGWGDAEIVALVDPAHFGIGDAASGDAIEVTAYGSVKMSARLGYDSIAHRLVLGAPSAQADIELTSPGGTVLDEVPLRDALAGALEQAALARLAAVIGAVPLPEADLSGMLGAPPGSALELLDPNLGRASRFHRVGGSLGAFY